MPMPTKPGSTVQAWFFVHPLDPQVIRDAQRTVVCAAKDVDDARYLLGALDILPAQAGTVSV